ncbi:hypothetical protein CUT44_03160 [Streptomyces carminius]|uniref:Uncharacterized protein n=1 Tax=Streptomyces carminius TaxID=2665496 RepID=A0A2M8M5P1_9ACTN|nr:hypothetical protein [Streptomyces carminius]PJE99531.1 hypothetical protein CUT44_03160 [Streptomyces carminius]
MTAIPVTVVGPKESGKTVYLASLFRRLAMQRDDVGFFVQVSPEQAKKLNNIYQEIVAPDTWPEATLLAHTPEWEFACSVRTGQGRVFSPFTVSYLDFAGEHLTGSGETETGKHVWERIRKSEFLLVLLDGVKVLRCFDGDYRLVDELVPVFNALQSNNAVVHFVVTKWDLLEAAGHTVGTVLDRLQEHDDFRACFEDRLRRAGEAGALRLIPVSSLGAGFAVPGPDGETMIKKGRFPRPQNVEVPMMAVLVDLFDKTLKDMERAQPGRPDDDALRRRTSQLDRLRTFRKRIPAVRAFLQARAATSPAARVVRDTMLDALVDYVDRQVSEYDRKIEHDVARLRGRVTQARTEKEALIGLVRSFRATLADFEVAHPGSSVLGKAS